MRKGIFPEPGINFELDSIFFEDFDDDKFKNGGESYSNAKMKIS